MSCVAIGPMCPEEGIIDGGLVGGFPLRLGGSGMSSCRGGSGRLRREVV